MSRSWSWLCPWHRAWHTGSVREAFAKQMSMQERTQALRGGPTGPDLPSCLAGDTLAQWAAPSSVPRVPRTGGERTFSGAAGEIYPAVSHFSRVCKYLGLRGRQHPRRGSFSAFYELPAGPNARFLWLGMWGVRAVSQLVGTGWGRPRGCKKLQDATGGFWHLTPQRASCFKKMLTQHHRLRPWLRWETERTPSPGPRDTLNP